MEYLGLPNSKAVQAALSAAVEGAKKYGIPEEVLVIIIKRTAVGLFVPVGHTFEEMHERKELEGTPIFFNNAADTVFTRAMTDAFNRKGMSNEEKEKITELYKKTMNNLGLCTVFNPETIYNPKWMERAVQLFETGNEDFMELMTLAMSRRKTDEELDKKGRFTVHQGLVPLAWIQNFATRKKWEGQAWFRFTREQCSEAQIEF